MKKIFGMEIEFNFTADEGMVKRIGKGTKNVSAIIQGIVKKLELDIVKYLQKELNKKEENKYENN